MAQIHELLPLVARDIGVIGKDKKNSFQNYNYRGIEAVMDACHASLTKHGVTMIPTVLTMAREERPSKRDGVNIYTMLTVRYDFTAPDGSLVSAVVVGEGMDNSDKSSNKALSAAFKYVAGQVFSIPFDNIDSETDSVLPAKPAPTVRLTKPAEPVTAAPSPEQVLGSNIAAELNTIIELARRHGAKDREEILALVGSLAGRQITSTQQLSAAERAKVSALLKGVKHA